LASTGMPISMMRMMVKSEVAVEAEAAAEAVVDVVTKLLETDPLRLTDAKEVNLLSSKTTSLPYDRFNEKLEASIEGARS